MVLLSGGARCVYLCWPASPASRHYILPLQAVNMACTVAQVLCLLYGLCCCGGIHAVPELGLVCQKGPAKVDTHRILHVISPMYY